MDGGRWLVCILVALVFACPRGPEVAPGQPEEIPPPAAPGWARPILEFAQPPPAGHAGMYAIVRDRVGPLYAEMPPELRFLQRLFTGFEVRHVVERIERDRVQAVFEIYDQETRLLVVEPDELAEEPDRPPEIDRVRVESPLFRSPEGLGVGDRFEWVARAHGPLACRAGQRPENGEPIAICRAPGLGGLRWVFPAPAEPMPPGWLGQSASAKRLRGSRVEEVWWRPPED